MRTAWLALVIFVVATPPAEASDKSPAPAPSVEPCPVSVGAFWIAAIGSKQRFAQYKAMLRVSTAGQYALRFAVIGDAESMHHTISAIVDSGAVPVAEVEMTFAWPTASVAAMRIVRLTHGTDTEPECEATPVVSILNSKDEVDAAFDDTGLTWPLDVVATVQPVRVATDAEIMQRVAPRYPVLAVNQEHEGTVILSVIVGSYGRPLGVSIYHSSGHAELDQAALEAAWASIFKPAISNGTPTVAVYLIEYVFRLVR